MINRKCIRDLVCSCVVKQILLGLLLYKEWREVVNVLQITPEQFLAGKGIEGKNEIATAMPESGFTPQDIRIVEDYHGLKEEQQKRFLRWLSQHRLHFALQNRWLGHANIQLASPRTLQSFQRIQLLHFFRALLC